MDQEYDKSAPLSLGPNSTGGVDWHTALKGMGSA